MEKKSTPAIRFKGFTDPWEQRKLGEICEKLSYGVGASASPFDGRTRYLRITDIDDETREFLQDDLSSPDSNFALSDDNYLRFGDIVFARTGASVGKTYLNRDDKGDIVFAGFLIRAVLRSGYDSEFVYQQTLSEGYKSFVAVASQRSGQPGINAQEYSGWDVWVCSEKEQVKIGSFFCRLDDLITLHQRKLEMMKNFKKSMLEKMFPKNGSDVPEVRFKGFTDPWEQRKLEEVTDSYSGGTPTVGNSDYYGGNIPFIRSAEIASEKTELFLTEVGLSNSSAAMVEPGCVLYAMYGATSGEVSISKIKGAINQAILAILPHTGYDPHFIESWLRKEKHAITETYLQGGQGNLSGAIVKDIRISFPDQEEQRLVGAFFLKLDDLIALHQRKLDRLKDLKKSMLEKMFV